MWLLISGVIDRIVLVWHIVKINVYGDNIPDLGHYYRWSHSGVTICRVPLLVLCFYTSIYTVEPKSCNIIGEIFTNIITCYTLKGEVSQISRLFSHPRKFSARNSVHAKNHYATSFNNL